MATKQQRGRKKPEQNQSVANLIAALKFLATAQSDSKAETQHLHTVICDHWAVASNPIYSIGVKIEDDLNACPHTDTFIAALSKCGQSLSVTQLDSGKLSIKSDKFKALVPCVPGGLIPPVVPDSPCAVLNDALRAGFEAVGDIPAHIAGREWAGGVLLQAGSVVACDGVSLIEYWHGIDLPPGLIIPKATVSAVLKSSKPLAKFGFSPNSVTFWFEDESWIKTQLIVAKYPDFTRILNRKSNPWPLPEGFFTALKAVAAFNEAGFVYFNDGGIMSSHPNSEQGATYEVEGLPADRAYNSKFLLALDGKADRFDFVGNGEEYDNCMFFGTNLRGALAPIRR